MIAEHGERAQWVQNLRAQPHVGGRIEGRQFTARARVVDTRGESALAGVVRSLSEGKYGWSEGLIVELTPDLRSDL